jgi:hypothetical protein
MTIFFTKAGLFYEKWNGKKDVRRRVKKMSVWTHLRDACEIEEGVTLLDIFRTVDKYKALKVFMAQYSWCKALDAFHAQAEEPNYGAHEDKENPNEMTHLEIYWHADYSSFEETNYVELSPGFHGIGVPGPEKQGYCPDGKRYWSIAFSPMYRLADLPVKLDKTVEFFKPKDYKPGRKPIVKGQREFSLQDVLDAIYWEISFHGDPQEKSLNLDELIDDIMSGRAETVSADELFKDLDEDE